MTHQFAWVEKPFSGADDKWMMVRFNPLFSDEVGRMLSSGNYFGIAEAAQSPKGGENTLGDLDLLFGGKLKTLSSIPLIPGLHLCVELDLFGEPEPVKAVAVVARQMSDREDGMHVSALRFLAINKNWQPQAKAELPQYLAWA
jgi:hypothetical protein